MGVGGKQSAAFVDTGFQAGGFRGVQSIGIGTLGAGEDDDNELIEIGDGERGGANGGEGVAELALDDEAETGRSQARAMPDVLKRVTLRLPKLMPLWSQPVSTGTSSASPAMRVTVTWRLAKDWGHCPPPTRN